MFRSSLLTLSILGPLLASAQQIGTLTTETHPPLTWKKCTTSGGCVTQSASVVLDSNWRWLHKTTDSTNCYTGQAWTAECIANPVTCAQTCALDGANYSGTYGITTSGDTLTHKFVTQAAQKNIGSRVYLMDTANVGYQIFKPKNQEFTFDVDVSQLPCGLNGALYFVEMDADGGKAKYPTNAAGAKYGTGYCDAQCPHDIKFINGEANTQDWTPSTSDVNSGTGRYGSCCPEMDIWEANKISTAFTPHPCSITGQSRCTGTACGDGAERYAGVCDKDGCDFNSYRLGNKTFYGPAATNTIDTTKKVTVVTQFITAGNTATGALTEIRRLYVQNGVVISNSVTNVAGVTATNAISDNFCAQQKSVFGDTNYYQTLGGLSQMGTSLNNGMVLVMSIWDDHAVGMRWLDSNFPDGANPATPGVARGTCSSTEGLPTNVEANFPNSQVVFSNIRFGDIGSTYGTTTGTTTTTTAAAATTTAATGGSIAQWAQCGGINWTGTGTCVSGTTCNVVNAYYSQCQ